MKQTPRNKKVKKSRSRISRKSIDYRKWYILLPVIVITLLLIGYFSRGWVRFSLEPKIVSATSDKSLAVLDEQYSQLGKPFETLGLPAATKISRCSAIYASKLQTEVGCYSNYSSYGSNLPADLATRAARLEKALKNQGWSGGNTTISVLGMNIGKGIDYTPDAAYQKQIGGIFCLADFNTAFSKPKPPALNGTIGCSQEHGLFGTMPQFQIQSK
jgi:hypothetical protein